MVSFVLILNLLLQHRIIGDQKDQFQTDQKRVRKIDEKKEVTRSLHPSHHDFNLSMFAIPVEQWNRESTFRFRYNLKFYVYENLPSNISTDVERCLLHLYTHTIDHVENFKAELGLIYLFRTSPFRTHNPQEAHLFVVPYAAEGHCQCHSGYTWNCAQVPDDDIQLLLDTLTYFNTTTRSRHLFILAGAQAKQPLWSMPLRLTTAPAIIPGQIVIPNLEDKAPFQPSAILARGTDWWTSRKRKYSFSFIYGGRNSNMKNNGRKFRDFLETDIATNYPDGKLAGQEFYMKRWSSPHEFHKLTTFAFYNQSILCPCLPGDLAWQKRFFDVILNGCLPVVLQFETPNLPGGKTWFLPENNRAMEHSSVQQTYPFAKGAFPGASQEGPLEVVDYESFVVEVPMNRFQQKNVSGIMTAMERVLNNPEELRRRRLAMMKYAMSFTYGMGEDAHVYEDAFSKILSVLEYQFV